MCHPEFPSGVVAPNVVTREVAIPGQDGGTIPALLALPRRLPAPAVIIANDVFGRGLFYEHLAMRLAQAGFVALEPELFYREGPLPELTIEHAMQRAGRLNDVRALAEVGLGLDWLLAQPEVRGPAAGLVGFCMGGTQALLLAAQPGRLGAAVCYYGFPVARRAGRLPQPIDIAGHITTPVLGLWGDQDEGVGMDNVEKMRTLLVNAGAPHEFHVYPGVGHGFLKAFLENEATPGYTAACDSWTRSVQFLHKLLN